ncbi:MAG: glutamate--cysteine ligase, partial [Gammaproteobacteria bacterium]|nr:glutamate--cysteine ligase [Gammaproteobacteria bacterium]
MRLEEQFINHQSRIESWFREQWRISRAPFYSSVDIRNAGYKIAPVDTNLFPAGFNNLNPEFESLCIQAIQQAVERIDKPVDRIVLIPENHTRNKFYLSNVAMLASLIIKAGFEVKLGSLMEELTAPASIPLDEGE